MKAKYQATIEAGKKGNRENTRLKQNSKLGKSMMSIDFIGPMHLKGSDNRINFLSCKYIRPEKRGIVTRIEGPISEKTITALKEILKTHPIPEILNLQRNSGIHCNSAMNRRLTPRSRILTSLMRNIRS